MFKQLTLSLLLLNLFTATSYPMAAANPITRQAAKELFKKGIEKGTTALHWAIAAGPCWNEAKKLHTSASSLKKQAEENTELFLIAAGQETIAAQWVREELKKQRFADWEKIALRAGSFWGSLDNLSGDQLLSYPEEQIEMIIENESALNSPSDELLNSRGSLIHEMTHLQKRHGQKQCALALSMPGITHIVWNKVFNSVKTPYSNFWISNSFKMMTGLSKLFINMGALWMCKYLHEKEADEGINEIDVLEAKIRYFKKKSELVENAKKADWKKSIKFALDPHPHPLKRAQRFEERTAQLRAAQQKI